MRDIKKIFVHCSATLASDEFDVEDLRRWHVDDRGWSDVGYHYVITTDGTIQDGRPIERAGAHVRHHNADSIGICLIGGVNKNWKPVANFTDKQWESLARLVRMLKAEYTGATVHGHNEFSNKACPSFDVQEWLIKENI